MAEADIRTQDDLIGYGRLDPFKQACVKAGRETSGSLATIDAFEVEWSRGESCFVVDHGEFYTGEVNEGLGTKNLGYDILALIRKLTVGGAIPSSLMEGIGIDCVAMIVIDMITLGIAPFSLGMHLAVGDSHWFDDEDRAAALVRGFAKGAQLAGAVWGYGETPTLAGIVGPDTFALSGNATGILYNKSMLVNPANIQAGDVLIGLRSSGIHANGLTMAREIADRAGYADNPFASHRAGFGHMLLEPTEIYVSFLRACQAAGLHWSYGINVTGHGWRKIMRAVQPWTYRITTLPVLCHEMGVFEDLQMAGNVSPRVMYETFNMGIGFIVIVRPDKQQQTLEIASKTGHHPTVLGVVEEGPRQVIIEPIDVVFDELGVR